MQALRGVVSRTSCNRILEPVRKDSWTNMAGKITRSVFKSADERRKAVDENKQEFLDKKLEDKRKLYRCKEKYTELENILTWPQYFEAELKEDEQNTSWWRRNKKKVAKGISEELNEKMSIFTGDITSLEIDAIANAANESLLGGGGVDGAIHAAAGSLLRSECELLNGCEPGDAKITGGYKLPAKYVIHTVGPRGERTEVLKSCYKKCLDLLKENELRSVAFPCISTGIFGYPNENAAKVALGTIREWLEKEDNGKNIDRIIMCLFLKKDVAIYHEQMQMFFPLGRLDSGASSQMQDTKKTSEESISEATNEVPAESAKESIKEGTSEFNNEVLKESRNENTDEVTNEVPEESTKEDTKDVTNKSGVAAKQNCDPAQT